MTATHASSDVESAKLSKRSEDLGRDPAEREAGLPGRRETLLALQRSRGNCAARKLLTGALAARSAAGGGAGVRVSQPSEEAELDAERLAESLATKKTCCCDAAPEAAPAPPARGAFSGSGTAIGRAIDAVRAGAGSVPPVSIGGQAARIHADLRAAALADALNARAFTVRGDVFFARGRYTPDTHAGRRLIGHELAHVAQQSRAPSPVIQRDGQKDRCGVVRDIAYLYRKAVEEKRRADADKLLDDASIVDAEYMHCRLQSPNDQVTLFVKLRLGETDFAIALNKLKKKLGLPEIPVPGLPKEEKKVDPAKPPPGNDADLWIEQRDDYLEKAVESLGVLYEGKVYATLRGSKRVVPISIGRVWSGDPFNGQEPIKLPLYPSEEEARAAAKEFADNGFAAVAYFREADSGLIFPTIICSKTAPQFAAIAVNKAGWENLFTTSKLSFDVLSLSGGLVNFAQLNEAVLSRAVGNAPRAASGLDALKTFKGQDFEPPPTPVGVVDAPPPRVRPGNVVDLFPTGRAANVIDLPRASQEPTFVVVGNEVKVIYPDLPAPLPAGGAQIYQFPNLFPEPVTQIPGSPLQFSFQPRAQAQIPLNIGGLTQPLQVLANQPAPAQDQDDDKKKKKRPPFVLPLPNEKSVHLSTYRSWLGVLEDDPAYARPNTSPTSAWRQALRPAGSNGMSLETFQRGIDLGLDAEDIIIPNWSRTKSTSFQVDHIVELQVVPPSRLGWFDSIDNFELLDSRANGSAGPRMAAGIAAQRAVQESLDPSLAGQVMKFDKVQIAGGGQGERWTVDEIQTGEHLDEYERTHPKEP